MEQNNLTEGKRKIEMGIIEDNDPAILALMTGLPLNVFEGGDGRYRSRLIYIYIYCGLCGINYLVHEC